MVLIGIGPTLGVQVTNRSRIRDPEVVATHSQPYFAEYDHDTNAASG